MALVQNPVAQGYDQSAPLYDFLVGPSYAATMRQLLSQVQLPPRPAVLDVGCGTGIALIEVCRRAPGGCRLAAGVDVSPEMVRQARRKAAALGMPAWFAVASAETLPFPSGLFDIVVSSSAFHWFPDRRAALAEMLRVLKPGGLLLLVSAAPPCALEWWQALDRACRRLLGRPAPNYMLNWPTRDELLGIFLEQGWEVLAVNHRVWPFFFGDVSSLQRNMDVALPHWKAGLPPNVAAAVGLETIRELMRGNGGRVPLQVTWAALDAIARKPFMSQI